MQKTRARNKSKYVRNLNMGKVQVDNLKVGGIHRDKKKFFQFFALSSYVDGDNQIFTKKKDKQMF